MAAREVRASWKRLAFFFLSVAVGVGAIVALRSAVQQVRVALQAEARTLLAADVVIRTRQPWTEEARRLIAARIGSASVRDRVETVEVATMVRPADPRKLAARLAEVRGVERGFPLYGRVDLEGGQVFSHDLLADRGALVRPELLTYLDVRVGDRILIGRDRFTIRGVLKSEPGQQIGPFSFGPRVLVDYDDLLATKILSFGSRARYQMLLRVDDAAIGPLVRQLRNDLRHQYVSAWSYRDEEAELGEDLQRAENYLSLIGFVIVVLGGVGVSSVIRVFVRQKLKTIAILKCLGARTRQILAAYLVQMLVLAASGSLAGVGLAAALLAAVPADLAESLPTLRVAITPSAALQGMAVGLLVSLLFALVPLVDLRHVKPLVLLRHEAGQAPSGVDWVRGGVVAILGASLVGVAIWQAGSLEAGAYVSAGFVGVTLVLYGVAALLIRAVAPLAESRWFSLRHAVLHLSRPGNQTRAVLVAVGVGSFFILGVEMLQRNLVRELAVGLRPDAPDLFLIDIQPDQSASLERFLRSRLGRAPAPIPVVRARVTGVYGRTLTLDGYDDVRRRGSLGREYVVTYRPHLEANERVVEGRFWTEARGGGPRGGDGSADGRARPVPEAEVSIEDSLRDRFGIGLGDRLRFDILGRTVDARVTSVRRVQWEDARRGGFMFVFRPGVLERAPHTYVVPLRGPADPAARARLQRDLVAQFPNVSAIDVRDALDLVRQVIERVTLAVAVVGGIAVVSGVLILIGSVAMTKFERLHDTAVFKTLGASTRSLAALFALEYGTLGALAGLIGAGGAVVMNWVLTRHLLEIEWYPAPWVALAGLVATTGLVGLVGVGASVDVLRRKPLAVLRAE